MSWEYNEVKKLIEWHKNTPELWDPEHNKFREFAEKEKIIKRFATKLNRNKWQIKSKLKSLRHMYRRIYFKVKARENQGKKYTKTIWQGYYAMSYLERVINKADDTEVATSSDEQEANFNGNNSDSDCDKTDYMTEIGKLENNSASDNDKGYSNMTEIIDLEDDSDSDNVKKVWNMTEIKNLVEIYKEHSLLWDSDHPQYNFRASRLNAIKHIAESLNVSAYDVQIKLKSLRNIYFRTHKKVKAEIKTKGRFNGKLWYGYEMLSFLNNEKICVSKLESQGQSSSNVGYTEPECQVGNESSSDSECGEKNEKPWTKKEVFELINDYKENQLLWDPNHPRNNYQRDQVLSSIGKKFKREKHEIRRKLKSLRGQYFRAQKRKLGRNGKPKAQLWFAYNQMSFLGQPIATDEQEELLLKEEHDDDYDKDNYNDSLSVNDSENISHDSYEVQIEEDIMRKCNCITSEDPLAAPRKHLMFNSAQQQSDDQMQPPQTNEGLNLFGQFIAEELRKINNEYRLLEVKNEITNVIFKALKDQLKKS